MPIGLILHTLGHAAAEHMRRVARRATARERRLRIGVDIRPFYEPLTGVGWYLYFLLHEFAKREEVVAIVRGLRAISDFEFEFQIALMNRKMEPTVETIFMMPKEEFTYISSRIVKEIARLGGNVQTFVPDCVVRALAKKFLS